MYPSYMGAHSISSVCSMMTYVTRPGQGLIPSPCRKAHLSTLTYEGDRHVSHYPRRFTFPSVSRSCTHIHPSRLLIIQFLSHVQSTPLLSIGD